MTGGIGSSWDPSNARYDGHVERLRAGRLAPFLYADTREIRNADDLTPGARYSVVLSAYLLQDIADYRGAIATWFAAVQIGGYLVLAVPHAFLHERRLDLPVSERPGQQRLYTPAALLAEVEEALSPNSYRVRLLCDEDGGYDYQSPNPPTDYGASDVLLVLEKLAEPPAALGQPAILDAGPDYAFTPPRTRVEHATRRPCSRILVLKLDHLGDFVMGVPALERLRAAFPDSHMTLVVGSWNAELASGLNLADEIVSFDAFPRNSAQAEVDVPGKRKLFETLLPEAYDLAIDLRTDTDTRTLLGRVRAPHKAGIGQRAHHPFLDIALPIDLDRVHREAAEERRFDHHAFATQGAVDRLPHRAVFDPDRLERERAIIWGPYERIRPGRYILEPLLEQSAGGILMIDAAVDNRRLARRFVAPGDALRLAFDVEQPGAFEARVWAVDGCAAPAFSFYGIRLVREGAPGLIHQSDYLILLVEFVVRRMEHLGFLSEVAP